MTGKSSERFINRELSWMEFNDRVLSLACDHGRPLLERVKFLAITASNLDEFFMVRVGGLQLLAQRGVTATDPAGLTPARQLAAIDARLAVFLQKQYRCFRELFEVELPAAGIARVPGSALTDRQADHLFHIFSQEIYPVLSPIAVSSATRMPLLTGRLLYLCARLSVADSKRAPRFALIPISKSIPRFISLPDSKGYLFSLAEEAIAMSAAMFFPGERVLECVPFRIIRNADVAVVEDSPAELLEAMEDVIDARKRAGVVRLEIDARASEELLAFLRKTFGVEPDRVCRFEGPLDLSALMRLAELKGFEALRAEPLPPLPSPALPPNQRLFDSLKKGCALLVHPYESFDPVVRFVGEAAADPDVLAIKQTLYRTSRASPIIAALIDAAEKGKSVTAVVELKARFDEERNIEWAREMEDAGVQVVHGVRNLKTHAKLCLVVRQEAQGLQRYVHLGTGNYNEITARLYSDVSFFTADPDIGADASSFFNALTGSSEPLPYRAFSAAPIGLRETLIDCIDAEARRRAQGQKAWIKAKMNSLSDKQIIEALYGASCAGVPVGLNVRGICCLVPGKAGLSETITVKSIVDSFLEHSRIFAFCNGGKPLVFISSADMMPRNLDKRVELLVPVEDPRCRDRLLDFLDVCLGDNAGSWLLLPDGRWERMAPPTSRKIIRCQDVMYKRLKEAAGAAQRGRTMFRPHRPGPGAKARG